MKAWAEDVGTAHRLAKGAAELPTALRRVAALEFAFLVMGEASGRYHDPRWAERALKRETIKAYRAALKARPRKREA